MEKIFWLLWNPQGQTPPTKRFSCYEEAEEVATAMQQRLGVGTMYILKAVQSVSVAQTVKWEGLREAKNVR